MRRSLLLLAAAAAAVVVGCIVLSWWAQRPWPAWEAFAREFVQADGRVIDHTAAARSTSEAQVYALFFALVANDRARFEQILGWTENNLAGGDLEKQLPAWLWGRRDDDSWGVIDDNPASDADLWLAYTLVEAARLWDVQQWDELGRVVLWQIKAHAVVPLGSRGPMVLPAPRGFHVGEAGWRLNPSYLPEFQFRRLAKADPSGPWREILETYLALAPKFVVDGRVPDWFVWTPDGLRTDPESKGVGSYDAIRVYLWASMTPDSRMLHLLRPFLTQIKAQGAPPEFVEVGSGGIRGRGPLGFSAAVLPFLHVLNEDTLLESQRKRLNANRKNDALGAPAHYYDQVLALFGEGWLAKRFHFDGEGQLEPRWVRTCYGYFC